MGKNKWKKINKILSIITEAKNNEANVDGEKTILDKAESLLKT